MQQKANNDRECYFKGQSQMVANNNLNADNQAGCSSQNSANGKNCKLTFTNQYMSEKAGMASVDKQKIAAIIEKLTEGTPKSIYEKEQRQKRQIQLASMLKKTMEFSKQQRQEMVAQWQSEIQKLEGNRNLQHYWAHFDFDMFYVACELLDKPELRDKPCAVGGESMISTSNYQARKFGVRAALPGFIAKKLCPDLVLIKTDFPKYKKFSNIFRDILRKYDPQLETHGLDEAYVDLTSQLKGKTHQEKHQFINAVRNSIYISTGLTVSCGVGANKMLAKLASEERKPNDQFILPNDSKEILGFMRNKKIRKIPGIGPVNQFFMKGMGLETANDILQNLDILTISFSRHSVEFYVSAALGLGSIEHEYVQRKSLGRSQTFKVTDDSAYLQRKVRQLCQQVSIDLEEIGYVTENVVFSYQTQAFNKKDKSFRLSKYTSKKQDFLDKVLPFMKTSMLGTKQKIRLLWVRCTIILPVQQLRKMQLDKYITADGESNCKKNEKAVTRSSFFCPICNEDVDCKGNLTAFNRHIDKCMLGQPDKAGHQDQQKANKQPSLKQKPKKSFNLLQKQRVQQQSNPQEIGKIKLRKNGNNVKIQKKSDRHSGSILSFLKKAEQ